MGLTVREAINLEGVNRIELVAGEAGLDREITNVTVIEVPDAAKWLKGGEFLITAFFNFRHALESQLEFMAAAADKGCAALAILSHPEGYGGDLPELLKQLANQLLLPLFRIPNEIAYADITFPIYGEIVNRQARELKFALDAHSQMTEAVLAGKQLADLVNLLANLMRNPVMVLDRWGQTLAISGADGAVSASFFKSRMESPNAIMVTIENGPDDAGRKILEEAGGLNEEPPLFLRRAIRAGRSRYGDVIVWVKNSRLSRLHVMALEQACVVLALYMEKERVVQEVRSHLHRDLLDDLLSGVEPDRMDSRFRSVGWNLENKKAVLIVKVERDKVKHGKRSQDPEDASADEYKVVRDVLARDSTGHIGIRRGNSIVILVQAEEGASHERIKKNSVSLAKALVSAFASKHVKAAVGVGNPCDSPVGLRRSYDEAKNALALGKKVSFDQRVFQIDDLIGYYYLLRSQRSGEHVEFVSRVIGPLSKFDKENDGQLVQTLEAVLACESAAEAARQLYIHRNTLRHRLEKIKDILGYDPLVSPHRLNVQLALAMRRLLA